jgi:hypothetical protein
MLVQEKAEIEDFKTSIDVWSTPDWSNRCDKFSYKITRVQSISLSMLDRSKMCIKWHTETREFDRLNYKILSNIGDPKIL